MDTETPTPSSETHNDKEAVEKLHAVYERMRQELSQVIVGQSEVVEQVLMAISCRGHALLVGVPGLAKTLLVSTLSQALDLSFKRIQFTPDLMPRARTFWKSTKQPGDAISVSCMDPSLPIWS